MRHAKKKRILDDAAGLGETVDSGHVYPPHRMTPEGHRHDDYTGWLKANRLLDLTDEEDRELEMLAIDMVKRQLRATKEGGPAVDRDRLQKSIRAKVAGTLDESERAKLKALVNTYRAWSLAFDEEADAYAKILNGAN